MDVDREDESCEVRSDIIPRIFAYIKNLKNTRAFGLLLGIDPGVLDDFERRDSPSERVIELIIREWLRQSMTIADRWEELGRVLLEPAVDEPTIAGNLKPHLRRGSSVDSDRSSFSFCSSPSPNEASYIGNHGPT
jgi:hypothetical protein